MAQSSPRPGRRGENQRPAARSRRSAGRSKNTRTPRPGTRVKRLTGDGSENVHPYFTSASFVGDGGAGDLHVGPLGPLPALSAGDRQGAVGATDRRGEIEAQHAVPCPGRTAVLFRRRRIADGRCQHARGSRVVSQPRRHGAAVAHLHGRRQVRGLRQSAEAGVEHGDRPHDLDDAGDLLPAPFVRGDAGQRRQRRGRGGVGRAGVDQSRADPPHAAQLDPLLPRGRQLRAAADVDGSTSTKRWPGRPNRSIHNGPASSAYTNTSRAAATWASNPRRTWTAGGKSTTVSSAPTAPGSGSSSCPGRVPATCSRIQTAA